MRVEGLGFRVYCLGFGVGIRASVFVRVGRLRVEGFGFRVEGVGLGLMSSCPPRVKKVRSFAFLNPKP